MRGARLSSRLKRCMKRIWKGRFRMFYDRFLEFGWCVRFVLVTKSKRI